MNFDSLVESIQVTHRLLQQDAVRAINRNLTVRNWLIGFYIVTFEQGGEDRAGYGEQLLQRLSERLHTDGFSYRNLKLYRQFYQTYPQIGVVASQVLKAIPRLGRHCLPNCNCQARLTWRAFPLARSSQSFPFPT
jgi:hypothetical protein